MADLENSNETTSAPQALASGGSHDQEGDEHHGSLRQFMIVFGGLVVLTAISFTVANLSWIMATPAIGWTIMMAVSCMKALLVTSYFMHLKWEASWKYVLTIPASLMCVFLLLMLTPDVGRRTEQYSKERWLHAAEPETSTDDAAETTH